MFPLKFLENIKEIQLKIYQKVVLQKIADY